MHMNIFTSRNIDSQVEAMLHQAHHRRFSTDRRWQVVITISVFKMQIILIHANEDVHDLASLHIVITRVILHELFCPGCENPSAHGQTAGINK